MNLIFVQFLVLFTTRGSYGLVYEIINPINQLIKKHRPDFNQPRNALSNNNKLFESTIYDLSDAWSGVNNVVERNLPMCHFSNKKNTYYPNTRKYYGKRPTIADEQKYIELKLDKIVNFANENYRNQIKKNKPVVVSAPVYPNKFDKMQTCHCSPANLPYMQAPQHGYILPNQLQYLTAQASYTPQNYGQYLPPQSGSIPPNQPQYFSPQSGYTTPNQPQYLLPQSGSTPPNQPQYFSPQSGSTPPNQPQNLPPQSGYTPQNQPQYPPPQSGSTPPNQPHYLPPQSGYTPQNQPQNLQYQPEYDEGYQNYAAQQYGSQMQQQLGPALQYASLQQQYSGFTQPNSQSSYNPISASNADDSHSFFQTPGSNSLHYQETAKDESGQNDDAHSDTPVFTKEQTPSYKYPEPTQTGYNTLQQNPYQVGGQQLPFQYNNYLQNPYVAAATSALFGKSYESNYTNNMHYNMYGNPWYNWYNSGSYRNPYYQDWNYESYNKIPTKFNINLITSHKKDKYESPAQSDSSVTVESDKPIQTISEKPLDKNEDLTSTHLFKNKFETSPDTISYGKDKKSGGFVNQYFYIHGPGKSPSSSSNSAINEMTILEKIIDILDKKMNTRPLNADTKEVLNSNYEIVTDLPTYMQL